MSASLAQPRRPPRVLVIGLDCVPPLLAFDRYRAVMPNLSRLMATGTWGPLRSTIPPITVPAWASMFSGRDPGELGLYGFRNRRVGSYGLQVVSSHDLQLPMLWDQLSDRHVCVLFVPPGYPPRAVHGELVSCFLTPDADCEHTYPPALAHELRELFGPYRPDVADYRTDDIDKLLADLYAGTSQRFAIAEHLLRTRRPELCVMVEIGPDRLHHALWAQIDPDHPGHVRGNPHCDAGRSYYAFLDQQLGRSIAAAGEDTTVLVVSDHGARPLRGGINVNEWLIERGYLVLRRYPEHVTPFAELDVDWNRTRAWGEGGYYARIALNVQGREPSGLVPPRAAAALCDELARELAQLPGPDGSVLSHRIVTPDACYRSRIGLAPDLMVFFDDLGYRSIGSVGHRSVYSTQNDTGADSCNHDWDGIFVLAGPGVVARGAVAGLSIADVTPTILALMQEPDATLPGVDQSGQT